MNKNESPGRRLGISAFGGAAGAERRREKLILFGLIPQKLRVINQDRAEIAEAAAGRERGAGREERGEGGRLESAVIPGRSVAEPANGHAHR